MPSFLNRYYGIAPDQAGLKAAIVILLGAVVLGILADRAGRKQPSQAVSRGLGVRALGHGIWKYSKISQ